MIVLLASTALAADSDLDGIDDTFDDCPWEDDSIDIDGNGVADCDETMLEEFGMAAEASATSAWVRATSPATAIETWDPDDLHGYPYSGSMMFADMVQEGSTFGAAFMETAECIALTDDTIYTLTARFAAIAPDSTEVFLGVRLFMDSDCEHHWYEQGFYPLSYWTDTWIVSDGAPDDLALSFATPPGGAQFPAGYAKVRVIVYQDDAGSRAWVDSIALRVAADKMGGDDEPGPPSIARALANGGDNPSDDRSQGRNATE